MNDDLLGIKGKKSTRFIYYLGDQPKLALQSVVTNVYKRHAHMFIGIKGEKWLDEMPAMMPVDFVICDAVELTDMLIVQDAEAGINVKLTNNTEKNIHVKAILSTVSNGTTVDVTIPAKSSSDTIYVPVKKAVDLTPGNNRITSPAMMSIST